ncbi:MAG TPA: DNA-processing protein DprA [Nitrospirota bacterium]
MFTRTDAGAAPLTEPKYWIALSRVGGLGKVLFRRLILRFETPEAVFRAPEIEICRVEGCRPATAKAVKSFCDWDGVDDEVDKAEKAGAHIVSFIDPSYPANLRETHDPPPYLYVKGGLIEEDRVSVAIVGSRMATDYGRKLTRKMARELSAKGVTVVSGGARGIDTEAHRGALEGGGRTIAVLGCGIDVVYPGENKELFARIAERGAVVSEYPMGTPPESQNFPPRNRIISGISMGVLVMEAAEDSGSLITAQYSLEQGREVYALPGSVGSPTSKGTNCLIKKGAKLVEKPDDILEDLFPYIKGYLRERDIGVDEASEEDGARREEFDSASGAIERLGLEGDEATMFGLITAEPSHIDQLAEKSGIAVPKALSLLLGMELKGAVRQVPGMRFVRED